MHDSDRSYCTLRSSSYKSLSLAAALSLVLPTNRCTFVSLYFTLICLQLHFLLFLSVDTEHYIPSIQQLSQVTLVCVFSYHLHFSFEIIKVFIGNNTAAILQAIRIWL